MFLQYVKPIQKIEKKKNKRKGFGLPVTKNQLLNSVGHIEVQREMSHTPPSLDVIEKKRRTS